MKQQRLLNIELLRIFAMFLICLWHVNGHFLPLVPTETNHTAGIINNITPYLTFHVDLFVMITGYFGVRNSAKSVVKTCFLVIFYSLILGIAINCLGGDSLKWSHLLPFSGSPWWFMQVYLVLLLIAPFFEMYIQQASKNGLLSILCVTSFINIYLGWFRHMPLYDHHGYCIFNFLNLYIIGRWLHTEGRLANKLKQNIYMPLGVFVLCCAIRYKVQPVTELNWWDYSSPLNIAMAVCVFSLFLRLHVPTLLTKPVLALSSSVVAVYLITDYKGCYEYFGTLLTVFMKHGNSAICQFFLIIVFVTFVFLCCCLFDKLRIMITTPLDRFIYSKIEKYVKER